MTSGYFNAWTMKSRGRLKVNQNCEENKVEVEIVSTKINDLTMKKLKSKNQKLLPRRQLGSQTNIEVSAQLNFLKRWVLELKF